MRVAAETCRKVIRARRCGMESSAYVGKRRQIIHEEEAQVDDVWPRMFGHRWVGRPGRRPEERRSR